MLYHAEALNLQQHHQEIILYVTYVEKGAFSDLMQCYLLPTDEYNFSYFFHGTTYTG